MSNTEPPEDNEPEDEYADEGPEPDDDEPDATERERWADAACDRYERDMDARASQ
jgi:hypothetical protein